MQGCYNQAWDINYLSNWSSLYWDDSKYDETFFFATSDIMLKRIFINTHGDGDWLDLIETVFPKKEADRIVSFCNENMRSDRKRPTFGAKPKEYFKALIERENEKLKDIIKSNN